MKLMNLNTATCPKRGVAALKRPPCTKIKGEPFRKTKNAQHKAHKRDEKRFGSLVKSIIFHDKSSWMSKERQPVQKATMNSVWFAAVPFLAVASCKIQN